MPQITKETVGYIAKLARIACSEEQKEKILHDMKEILSYIELLNEVDTEGVEPCNIVLDCLTQTPLADDVCGPCMPKETFLKLAPDQIAGMVRVPEVLKQG